MLLARHLLSGAIAVVVVSAVTALPAEATVQQSATHTAVAGPAVCVDANGTRTNGTPVHEVPALARIEPRARGWSSGRARWTGGPTRGAGPAGHRFPARRPR
jgi:hypothetical protein